MSTSAPLKEACRETLLRQPDWRLELEKGWNEQGGERHAFVVYSSAYGKSGSEAGKRILSGEGHEVSRREIHYALYLSRRMDIEAGQSRASA